MSDGSSPRSYNPRSSARPTDKRYFSGGIATPKSVGVFGRRAEPIGDLEATLPPICVGSNCVIGNVTGEGCDGGIYDCKLVCKPHKDEPEWPKPPRVRNRRFP